MNGLKAILRPIAWCIAWSVITFAPQAAMAQGIEIPGLKLPGGGIGGIASTGEVEFSGVYDLTEDGSGQGQLTITAQIPDGSYVYSTEQAAPPRALKFAFEKNFAGKFSDKPLASEPPKSESTDLYPGIMLEKHRGEVSWEIPFTVEGETLKDHSELKITANGQVCTDSGSCIPLRKTIVATYRGVMRSDAAPVGRDLPMAAAAPNSASPTDGSTSPEAPAANSPPTEATAEHSAGSTMVTIPTDLPTFWTPKAHVTWTAWVAPAKVLPGGRATVYFHGKPDPTYHLYALPQSDAPAAAASSGSITDIVITNSSGTSTSRPRADQVYDTVELGNLVEHIYSSPVTFQFDVDVPKDADVGTRTIEGVLKFQTCKEGVCDRPVQVKFSALFDVVKQDGLGDTDRPNAVLFQDDATKVAAQTSESGRSVATILLAAFIGGFVLNFMPCVFPVIGLKVMSFISQADGSRGRIFMLNIWYVLGMMSVFWGLAAFAVGLRLAASETYSWGKQFSHDPFTIGLLSLVFAMALSFLGVWELPIPGFASGRSASGLQQREGPAGAFFKGIFTTLLATPCSGPGLGAVFAFTAANPVEWTPIAFTAIGFGMAFPYVILGLFPGLSKFMPRPGAWMETFKHLMGFVLLFVTAWLFMSVGNKFTRPTFVLLMGVWLGCWIAGRVAMYEPLWLRLRAWIFGGSIAAIIGLFAFTSFQPTSAALQAQGNGGNDTRVVKWEAYSEAKLAELQAQGKTVMIDFTADWCVNCKVNYLTAINVKEVGELLEELGVTPMLADWTDDSEEIHSKIRELNSASIPLLAIYPANRPNEPIVLRDLITRGQVLEALHQAGASRGTVARGTQVEGTVVGMAR